MRRLRAAITIGGVWALGWAASGAALMTWRVFFGHPRLAGPLHYWPRMALGGAVILGACGFLAGTLFAVALRKRANVSSVDSLSLRSSIAWGAIAGAGAMVALPFLGLTAVIPFVVAGAITSVVGAMSALATIKAARMGASLSDVPREARLSL